MSPPPAQTDNATVSSPTAQGTPLEKAFADVSRRNAERDSARRVNEAVTADKANRAAAAEAENQKRGVYGIPAPSSGDNPAEYANNLSNVLDKLLGVTGDKAIDTARRYALLQHMAPSLSYGMLNPKVNAAQILADQRAQTSANNLDAKQAMQDNQAYQKHVQASLGMGMTPMDRDSWQARYGSNITDNGGIPAGYSDGGMTTAGKRIIINNATGQRAVID
ncbi:MAG: hypothetical protein HQK97_10660 [Nitrospirae bacterium]|nr:hypothetical protein [Nitrospirota bacterium]